jgi:hypothetical protein
MILVEVNDDDHDNNDDKQKDNNRIFIPYNEKDHNVRTKMETGRSVSE